MKNKNPLYVVKGKTVQEAKGVFDMLVKRMNLEPVLKMLMNIIDMLLAQVTSYPTFVAMKTVVDELLAKSILLMGKFSRA